MLNTSSNNTEYTISSIEPYIFNKKANLIYGLSYKESNLSSSASYKLNSLTANSGFKYQLTDDIFHKLLIEYSLKDYVVTDAQKASTSVINSQGQNAEIAIINDFSYSTLNSFLRPTKGYSLKYSSVISPVTNSDNGYLKNILTIKKYTKIKQNTLSFQSKLANIISLQNELVATDNKFSLGGKWLRGFDSYGAGPRNSASSYVGGNNLFVTKFDLTRPLIKSKTDNPIDLNLFTDFGTVFENKTTPTQSSNSIRSSYGIGIKFYSPIGPIGFSWAFPITDESYDIKRMFLFSIGDIN